MRIFRRLYDKVIQWSHHRHAPVYLGAVSFIESSFFPVPPDVMLVSMSLAKPKRAWHYAFVASLASVFGGILGYVIGHFFLNLIYPYLEAMGYGAAYHQVQLWFQQWGFWVIFLAGFTPIPFKLFTIGAGAIKMAFWPFLLASLIGRSARFFLVSALMYWGGEHIDRFCQKYIDLIGLGVLGLLVLAYLLWGFV